MYETDIQNNFGFPFNASMLNNHKKYTQYITEFVGLNRMKRIRRV